MNERGGDSALIELQAAAKLARLTRRGVTQYATKAFSLGPLTLQHCQSCEGTEWSWLSSDSLQTPCVHVYNRTPRSNDSMRNVDLTEGSPLQAGCVNNNNTFIRSCLEQSQGPQAEAEVPRVAANVFIVQKE